MEDPGCDLGHGKEIFCHDHIVQLFPYLNQNSEVKNAWNYASVLPFVCQECTGTNLFFLAWQNIKHTTRTVNLWKVNTRIWVPVNTRKYVKKNQTVTKLSLHWNSYINIYVVHFWFCPSLVMVVIRPNELDVYGSVHPNTNRIKITNKMRPCSRIYYSNVS
jgi:hypothetical protein